MARAAKLRLELEFNLGTMPASYRGTMFPGEASGHTTERQAAELRRYARVAGRWPIILETRDGWRRLPLIDLSPGGAKVRLMEPLKEGTKGRLYFLPPHWHPRTVEALVWRVDLDGAVLRFAGPSTPPPALARGIRSSGSWLWTWQGQRSGATEGWKDP